MFVNRKTFNARIASFMPYAELASLIIFIIGVNLLKQMV